MRNNVILEPELLFAIVVCDKHLPKDAKVMAVVDAPCNECRKLKRLT